MKYIHIFDKNKLLILKSLFDCQDDICGCDLIERLNIPKNLLSYHISILIKNKLLKESRCGNKKIYTLSDNKIDDVKKVLKAVHLI